MGKKTLTKRPTDANQLAKLIVDAATKKENLEKIDSIELKNGWVCVYYTNKKGEKEYLKTGEKGFIAIIETHRDRCQKETSRLQKNSKKK
jgi:hypothetical protein